MADDAIVVRGTTTSTSSANGVRHDIDRERRADAAHRSNLFVSSVMSSGSFGTPRIIKRHILMANNHTEVIIPLTIDNGPFKQTFGIQRYVGTLLEEGCIIYMGNIPIYITPSSMVPTTGRIDNISVFVEVDYLSFVDRTIYALNRHQSTINDIRSIHRYTLPPPPFRLIYEAQCIPRPLSPPPSLLRPPPPSLSYCGYYHPLRESQRRQQQQAGSTTTPSSNAERYRQLNGRQRLVPPAPFHPPPPLHPLLPSDSTTTTTTTTTSNSLLDSTTATTTITSSNKNGFRLASNSIRNPSSNTNHHDRSNNNNVSGSSKGNPPPPPTNITSITTNTMSISRNASNSGEGVYRNQGVNATEQENSMSLSNNITVHGYNSSSRQKTSTSNISNHHHSSLVSRPSPQSKPQIPLVSMLIQEITRNATINSSTSTLHQQRFKDAREHCQQFFAARIIQRTFRRYYCLNLYTIYQIGLKSKKQQRRNLFPYLHRAFVRRLYQMFMIAVVLTFMVVLQTNNRFHCSTYRYYRKKSSSKYFIRNLCIIKSAQRFFRTNRVMRSKLIHRPIGADDITNTTDKTVPFFTNNGYDVELTGDFHDKELRYPSPVDFQSTVSSNSVSLDELAADATPIDDPVNGGLAVAEGTIELKDLHLQSTVYEGGKLSKNWLSDSSHAKEDIKEPTNEAIVFVFDEAIVEVENEGKCFDSISIHLHEQQDMNVLKDGLYRDSAKDTDDYGIIIEDNASYEAPTEHEQLREGNNGDHDVGVSQEKQPKKVDKEELVGGHDGSDIHQESKDKEEPSYGSNDDESFAFDTDDADGGIEDGLANESRSDETIVDEDESQHSPATDNISIMKGDIESAAFLSTKEFASYITFTNVETCLPSVGGKFLQEEGEQVAICDANGTEDHGTDDHDENINKNDHREDAFVLAEVLPRVLAPVLDIDTSNQCPVNVQETNYECETKANVEVQGIRKQEEEDSTLKEVSSKEASNEVEDVDEQPVGNDPVKVKEHADQKTNDDDDKKKEQTANVLEESLLEEVVSAVVASNNDENVSGEAITNSGKAEDDTTPHDGDLSTTSFKDEEDDSSEQDDRAFKEEETIHHGNEVTDAPASHNANKASSIITSICIYGVLVLIAMTFLLFAWTFVILTESLPLLLYKFMTNLFTSITYYLFVTVCGLTFASLRTLAYVIKIFTMVLFNTVAVATNIFHFNIRMKYYIRLITWLNSNSIVKDDGLFMKLLIQSLVHYRRLNQDLNVIKHLYDTEHVWNMIYKCMFKKFKRLDDPEVNDARHIEQCNWTHVICVVCLYMSQRLVDNERNISETVTSVLSDVMHEIMLNGEHQMNLDFVNPTDIQLTQRESNWRADVLYVLMVEVGADI